MIRRYGNIPQEYSAIVSWPVLLGGETEVIGPYDSGRELDATLRALTANLPGEVHPSVKLIVREVRADS